MIDWAAGTGRLTAAGKSLEWGAFGPPPDADPVIVLLHEGLGCLALWRDFPARLAAATGWPVFAWSRAGYGQSDPADLPRPIDYMTREACALPEVLAGLGDRPVVLLGHSDGATIAAEYAGRVADPRLLGLILMAPHFFTEPMGLVAIAEAGVAFRTTDLPARMARYHRDPKHTFGGWNAAWLNPDFCDWHVGDVIERWQVPALVIQGHQDQYGTMAQVDEVRRRSPAPVRTLMLEECRHAPHLEQTDAVLDAVGPFLRSLGGAGAT